MGREQREESPPPPATNFCHLCLRALARLPLAWKETEKTATQANWKQNDTSTVLLTLNCKCFVRSNEVLFVIYFLFRLTKRLSSYVRIREISIQCPLTGPSLHSTPEEFWKPKFHSENASNAFHSHYFGGIYKRYNHRPFWPFWTIRILRICRFFTQMMIK